MKNKQLKRRLLEISYLKKLSHIGSCMSMIDILARIYEKKGKNDKVIVSNGHAGLAQYICLEHYEGKNALQLFDKHGVHPNYDPENGIHASTGSLGHGLGIAVGYALAKRSKTVFCTISDGEFAEGSIYEACCIASENKIDNLELHVNCNGFGAYRRIYAYKIGEFFSLFQNLNVHVTMYEPEFPFLEGLSAHYKTLSDEEYKLGLLLTE